MTKQEDKNHIENVWRTFLTTSDYESELRQRRIFKYFPGTQSCRFCYAPLQGFSSPLVRAVYGKMPSKMNPHLCNDCDSFAEGHQGGAEIELSLLFADVRGSTTLAEKMTPMEFSNLINCFYNVATRIMIRTDALIDKIIGDQVTGMYVPSFVGQDHASRELEAARQLLHETGHDSPEGPWAPIGIGIHTGTSFVGSVGRDSGVSDITVLGDVPNTTARLSSNAKVGEILISEAAREKINFVMENVEKRTLELKGKSQPVTVHILNSNP